MPSTVIRSCDLHVGDIVDYHGHLHRVTHVDYQNGWAWPIAFDDAGWAIALGPDIVVVVQRAAAQPPHPLGLG